jgi:fructose 1,6-bisphosphatase
MWLGREDYDVKDWEQVKEDAAAAHNNRTARYLAGTPLLADFLSSGLVKLGYSVAELEGEAF